MTLPIKYSTMQNSKSIKTQYTERKNKMDLLQAKKKISELSKIIKYHSKRYYDDDSPEIEDFEYDELMRELKSIEALFPELITPDSPTQKVGGTASKKFSEVHHTIKMESLQDVFSFEELRDFALRLDPERSLFSVEPKIDGLSVSLEYESGELVRGSTRGDGTIGEDVTENLLGISSIPKRIPFNGALEVRGEVYMPFSSFEKLIAYQENNGLPVSKNPRNAAAGALRQKNAAISAQRGLDIFIFNIQRIDKMTFSSHTESLDFLRNQGFKVLPSYKCCPDIDAAIEEIIRIGNSRGSLSYGIDGAVIKINSLSYREELGSTSKYPKWAVAYKYPPEEKETTLRNIEVAVGRTGALTPTAVFDPILLAGTTVSRATLHNSDFIASKGISVGDSILVRKAGEIIPEVLQVTKHIKNAAPYHMPDFCPSCGAPVSRDEGEAVLRCTNAECPAQLLRHLIHFTSRDAMDIEGLGPAVLEQLQNRGLVRNISDIYFLNPQTIAQLERIGEKSTQNLINAIERSKSNDLSKLIYAFGIRHIGIKAASLISEHFRSMDKILLADSASFEEINGFGSIMAHSAAEFFALEDTLATISRLKEAGLNMNSLKEITDERFKGLTFVLTGTLPTYKRSEATEIIESLGGKTSASVSRKTSYVLAGEESGGKLDKANSLGIPVIDESEFKKMLE